MNQAVLQELVEVVSKKTEHKKRCQLSCLRLIDDKIELCFLLAQDKINIRELMRVCFLHGEFSNPDPLRAAVGIDTDTCWPYYDYK